MGESQPLIIQMAYISSMSSGQVLVPVMNQGMKWDFMGFSQKPPGLEQSVSYQQYNSATGGLVPVESATGGLVPETKNVCCGVGVACGAGCQCGDRVPRAPGGVKNVPKNNSSEGTERSRIFFSGVFGPEGPEVPRASRVLENCTKIPSSEGT